MGVSETASKPRRTIYEIGAVIATALLHPVFVDVLHQRAVFICTALGGWTSYLAWRVSSEEGTLQRFGFRRAAMGTGIWPKLVATALAALLFGAMHLPDLKLAAATCLVGAAFTVIYCAGRICGRWASGTPALSPSEGEREKHRQFRGVVHVTDC